VDDRHLENLSYIEVEEYLRRNDALVLPTGVLEPHGRHLPLGTDGHCAVAVAEAIAERLDALIAPCLHYGVIDRLAGYPGSSTVSGSTYGRLLRETINSFVGSGFRTIIVSNGHGPNQPIIERIARRLIQEMNVRAIVVAWYALTAQIAEEMYGDRGGHGGIQETSLLLSARPQLVKQHLYDENDFCLVTEGIATFPLASAMVLTRAEDKPVFDREKAEQFCARVLDHVASEVERAIAR
jgi:creatinine amidohydrolase